MRTIQVMPDFYRKKKIGGVSCYKVGSGVKSLAAIGWRVVKRASIVSSYTYMLPPEGVEYGRGEHPTIPLVVPDDQEIEDLANRLHLAGATWRGEAFGCSVRYTPRHTEMHPTTMINGVTGERTPTVQQWEESSWFEIRTGDGLWEVGCRWEQGDEGRPRWYGR